MKIRVLVWEPRSVAATARVKMVAARGTAVPRSAPTLPPKPPISSAVVNLKRSWGTFMKIRF